MTLEEATRIHDQVVRHATSFSFRNLSCKAFNAIQFRDSDEREMPSKDRLDGAVAELRLLGRITA